MEQPTSNPGSALSSHSLSLGLPGSDAPVAVARHAWVEACRFHALDDREVLDEVLRRISLWPRGDSTEKGRRPLVLFDLDSTLYEVQPRSGRILQEWVESAESAAFPEVRETVRALEERHLGYSLQDTFEALGLSLERSEVQEAWKSAKEFWKKRFFTDEYLRYDRPYPGAAEFAREVHGLGAEVVYLTGRDEPGMGKGTRRALLDHGFPWETERTHLLLKRAFEYEDLLHKTEAASYVRRNGNLVASFENEPANLVALHALFPEAMHVFVETTFSDKPAPPREGLYRIKGFSVRQ